MAATACTAFPANYSLSSTTVEACRPIAFLSCPNFFFRPSVASNKNPTIRLSSTTTVSSKHVFRVPIVAALEDDSSKEATIDLKLPRRSLLVQFTCNVCGERTERLINRLAYERGTVYVQCAGCLQHHKLVDNLGLVVEYDLWEDISVDSNTGEV